VYLLDHEYTEQGLNGTHLKGIDAVRAEAPRSAAELSDWEAVVGRVAIPTSATPALVLLGSDAITGEEVAPCCWRNSPLGGPM